MRRIIFVLKITSILFFLTCNTTTHHQQIFGDSTTKNELISTPLEEQGRKLFTIAFYNVENLFDTIDSPDTDDSEFLPTSEKQWNTMRYKDKLAKISQVISKIGDDDGAEIIGLCEIENRRVLEDLVKQPLLQKSHYAIVHYESPDKRGIDVALLYKEKEFTLVNSRKISIDDFNPNDNEEPRTRDILEVRLAKKNDSLTFYVVHLPSRKEGKEKSEFRRIAVASQLRKEIENLLLQNLSYKFIVMGDFNDEPTDKSIIQVLKADDSQIDQDRKLFNPMYLLKQAGKGTYFHQGKWELIDNILISDGILFSQKGFQYVNNSADIYAPEHLKQQKPEKFKGAPHRTFAGNRYLGGYSDHFGVYIYLKFK
ncbi:MAG: endonuclease/exonuclease/phosphatase family protein [Cytophagales bacterium]|nr:endonuclease/exonuclease/phosphatase family protein [Cytophagales bacterium]MDW8384982.1 endonuclease/exonuclease/phosphatase family protein [Flammeovirgaceae bacterium]